MRTRASTAPQSPAPCPWLHRCAPAAAPAPTPPPTPPPPAGLRLTCARAPAHSQSEPAYIRVVGSSGAAVSAPKYVVGGGSFRWRLVAAAVLRAAWRVPDLTRHDSPSEREIPDEADCETAGRAWSFPTGRGGKRCSLALARATHQPHPPPYLRCCPAHARRHAPHLSARRERPAHVRPRPPRSPRPEPSRNFSHTRRAA